MTRFGVRAPATVANLGPGFDCLALALDIRSEFDVDPRESASVTVEGEGSDEIPHDPSNLVLLAAHRVAREAGRRLPEFALHEHNRIPLERGLGSSAAAVVAGVLIGNEVLGTGYGSDRLLELAIDVEGHADNVAACLRGGLVIAYRGNAGWRAERLDPSSALRPVILIPETARVATERARRVLPSEVPFGDAVFNVSRAVLAVMALTDRPDLLGVALEDRLHQPHRLSLAPSSQRMFEELRRAGVPACVCGSGPSLLAFETEDVKVPDPTPGWAVLRPQLAPDGAAVTFDQPVDQRG